MLKDIPLSKTLLLAIFAVVVGALALVQHKRAKQSGVRPGMVQFDEMLFRRMIAERKKNIEACERARGNWPRRYGSDRFCEDKYPYPLAQQDKTLSAEFIRSLSKR